MNSNKTYYISLYGIMFATIFVAMMIDKTMSAVLPISTAAVVLLVTFCFCLIRNEWITGFCAGAFFGLASFLKALFFGELGAIPIYMAPIVYILPRLFVGIGAFAVYRLMLRLLSTMKSVRARQITSMSVGILIGLLLNTTIFLSMLNVVKRSLSVEYDAFFTIIEGVLYTNIIPEYLVSIIFAPILVLGVRKAMHYGIEAKDLWTDEDINQQQKQATDTESSHGEE